MLCRLALQVSQVALQGADTKAAAEGTQVVESAAWGAGLKGKACAAMAIPAHVSGEYPVPTNQEGYGEQHSLALLQLPLSHALLWNALHQSAAQGILCISPCLAEEHSPYESTWQVRRSASLHTQVPLP
jgi:hypothetical protein